uniref:CELLULASE n=1 Tax=Rhodothermus marinus TaxID=29549 RepID=UPI000175449B|nr:Chain A, CELLULASE [Rhodothermus marinus]3B7M_B Chain B, CELLULASE [Rhodothermus marinus]3B7M_C Chain C, CELLULASE [Rhodothermus marinus]3B7M_D Chain D, CELLULASE [Rhodothermus marinus]
STVELCGQWDTRTVAGGRYTVSNNVWGAETAQCIEVGLETGNFTITRAEHDNGNNVAAYPNIQFAIPQPRRVQELSDVRTSWTLTPITTGRWNAAYDIFFAANPNHVTYSGDAELMIWLNKNGDVMPIGSRVATVELAGATWEVWYADNGAMNVISYVRTTPTTSVTELDLKAFIDDAVARGYIRPEWYLLSVQTGFELFTGGAGLRSADFSVTVQ